MAINIILLHTKQIQGKQIPPGLCINVKSNTKKVSLHDSLVLLLFTPLLSSPPYISSYRPLPLQYPFFSLSPSPCSPSISSTPRLFPSLFSPFLHIETLSSPLTFKTSLPGCCLLPTLPSEAQDKNVPPLVSHYFHSETVVLIDRPTCLVGSAGVSRWSRFVGSHWQRRVLPPRGSNL